MAGDLDELLTQVADQADLAWNDETYDLALARSLSVDDRATYVVALMSNARQGDARAILTLGHLQAEAAAMATRSSTGLPRTRPAATPRWRAWPR